MTNNFKIIDDYSLGMNNEKIFEKIDKIESMILQNDMEYIYLEGRKTLEMIMDQFYQQYESLDFVISDFIKMNIVPSKVKNAFFSIKIKGNEDAHGSPKGSNIPYVIKKDIFAAIEFLKQLFIVIKFFVILENKIDWGNDQELTYIFDSSIYAPKSSTAIVEEIINKDTSPETESLTTETKGLFELVSSNYNFLIPTYQRTYSWEDENVLIFLQDIRDRMVDKQIHYMGSLAIAIDNENNLLRLIDGQQRITTTLLLIKAMIARFEKSKILKLPKELKELKLKISSKYINKTGQFGELNHVKNILSNNSKTDKDFLSSRANINYGLIDDYVSSLSSGEFEEFYTTFVYYFVVAELKFNNDLGSEIAIFENLNSKGLELSQWDLIKNYIYKKIDIALLLKEENQIEQMLNELFVIKSVIAFGNKNKHSALSDFFIYYSRIKFKHETGNTLNDKGKIHKVFSTVWPKANMNFNSLNNLRESLSDIAKYFDIYCSIKSKAYTQHDNPLFEYRVSLENTAVKDAHLALFMDVLYNNAEWNVNDVKKINNHQIVSEIFESVEKYIIRLLVVSNKGQSLPRFFDQLIGSKDTYGEFIKNIRETGKQSTIPKFSDFVKELNGKNDWQKEYALSVLRKLEANELKSTSKRYEIVVGPSLEHIFPQKPKLDSVWFSQSGLSISRAKEKHASRVNKIGNYVILAKSINSAAKNYEFSRKLNYYKEDDKSILINGETSGNLMNILLKNSFDFDDIDARTKQLAELIAPLYKFEFDKN